MFLPCWITLLGGGHRICDWLTMKDRLPPVITSYTWKTSNYIDLYSLQIVYNVYIIYIWIVNHLPLMEDQHFFRIPRGGFPRKRIPRAPPQESPEMLVGHLYSQQVIEQSHLGRHVA